MSTTSLYEHPVEIRFQDVDMAGIIFFARVFDLFHDAFLAGLAARGVRFADVMAARRWASPLVHAEADYRRPMRFGDRVVIELARVEFGNTSITTRYRIRDAVDPERVYASGHLVHAFVELGDVLRSCPVPDEVRAALG